MAHPRPMQYMNPAPMPGRVKYKVPARPPVFNPRLTARMASPQIPPPSSTSSYTYTNHADPHVDHTSLTWIVILSLILVASAIVVSYSLFPCCCRRSRRERSSHNRNASLQPLDARNEFQAWNANGRVAVRGEGSGYTPSRVLGGHIIPEPVVVDGDVPLTPVTPTATAGTNRREKDVTFWKKVRESQIGRAF